MIRSGLEKKYFTILSQEGKAAGKKLIKKSAVIALVVLMITVTGNKDQSQTIVEGGREYFVLRSEYENVVRTDDEELLVIKDPDHDIAQARTNSVINVFVFIYTVEALVSCFLYYLARKRIYREHD